jgi:predicted phage tail protein
MRFSNATKLPVLAFLATASFALAAVPPAPTIGSPNGVTVPTNQPTYTWTGDATATSYQLVVTNNGSSPTVTVPLTACNASFQCSYTQVNQLYPGNAWWSVRAVNVDGMSAWPSVYPFFNVPLPTAPTALGPTGTITNRKPAYSWNAQTGVTGYEFAVVDESGSVINPGSVSATCTNGVCSYTPNRTLANENNWWYVRSIGGPAGPSAWRETFFIVVQRPDAPTQISPSGIISTASPTFTWSAVAGAQRYYLTVVHETGAILNDNQVATTNCNATTCSFTGILVPGYQNCAWYVRVIVTGKTSQYGSGLSFRYHPPQLAAPSATSPLGTISNTSPSFVWTAVSGAAGYDLAVSGSAGTVIAEQRFTSSICVSSTCTASPGATIPAGAAYWWVRSVDSSGYVGQWSGANSFFISPPAPTAPTQISPSGILATATPTFSWNGVSGMTQYELAIADETGTRFDAVITPTCSGSPSVCSYSPGVALNPGNAWWWVRSVSGTGTVSAWAGDMYMRWQ